MTCDDGIDEPLRRERMVSRLYMRKTPELANAYRYAFLHVAALAGMLFWQRSSMRRAFFVCKSPNLA
jgi:hypothetical protein